MPIDPQQLSAAERLRALEAVQASRKTAPPAAPPRRIAPSPAFTDLQGYRERQILRQMLEQAGHDYPFFRQHEGRAGATSVINGKTVLNFGSYDYLGMNADPRPATAAKSAIDRYGVSASAARIVAGERPVHRNLEKALARHYEVEEALCFVSGHATNVSVISTLMGKGDLVIYDALVHNSAQVGTILSGASRRSFAHNDLAALETQLADTAGRFRATIVIVEGHYSMDGDIPDLARLLELKQVYGFWLMVDEAHGLGCIGPTGKGIREIFGIAGREVDIWMGTLSKTLASTGGYVAGSAALIDILKHEAPGSVFSVALAPALAAAAETSLRLLEAEPERVARLQANGRLFLERAHARGLDVGMSTGAAIVPVMTGSSLVAIAANNMLLYRGINALPIIFPAVSMNAARLRFFLSSLHTEEQIRSAVDTTADVLDELRDAGFDERLLAPPGQDR